MITLLIIIAVLIACLAVAIIKAVYYHEKMNIYYLKMEQAQVDKSKYELQRDLFIELTDSMQVLLTDIQEESDTDCDCVENFKVQIDRICSITPRLF